MAKTPLVASSRLALPLGIAGAEPDNAPVGTLAFATDTDLVRVKTSLGWANVGSGGGGTLTEVDGTNGIVSTNPTGPIVTLSPTYGSSASTFCEGNDSRLSNSRTPSGSAGGDLGGTFPNPSVTALHSATTSVNVSSAAAPSTGQVLTATSSTAATWQTPSGSPTGSAGGDLAGTYPNPSVAALHSATTSVNVSSATAPSAGQVLTATSSTAATWQTPSTSPTGSAGGDLSGTYPNPSVAALHSATTSVNVSSATAPSAGQALVATSSTAATWQTLSSTLSLRDPIWDPPTTASADDEEFTTDVLASGGVWTIALEGSAGTPLTRDGAIDLTQAVTSGHFRSSCIGSTLYVQLRQNEACVMWKTFAGALSSQQLWFVGAGFQTEMGSANTQDPKFGLAFWKNSSGAPDNANRAFVRTGTSNERYELLTVTSNATVTNTATNTSTAAFAYVDGLAMRINHGSSSSNNCSAFSFTRTGTLNTVLIGSSTQFNASTDKVGFYLQGNSSGTPGGVNAVIFALHFLRRVSFGTGWLAQA